MIGDRIHRLRKEKRLTLDQLAKAAGSSKSYMWELENKNPPRPSGEKLAMVAQALGVTVDYLLGTGSMTQAEAEDANFFRLYSSLPPATRRQIREIALILSMNEGALP